MSDSNETSDFWKEKCKDLEKVVKTLSAHCLKVVEKYEELLVNYRKNQEQYSHLVLRLRDKGEQIKKAKDVLEPIMLEYQTLKEKYELAVQCQYEAENFASKINHKNKALKRQSKMLLDKMGGLNITELKIEEEETESSPEETDYYKKLDKQIQDLGEEKCALSAQLKALSEDYQLEKERSSQLSEKLEACRAELKQAKSIIANQESTLLQLAKSSEAAYLEYEGLQKQFEQEHVGRTQAEKLAHNLYAEREAARHQSALLMKDIGADRKLMEALIEVENISTKMNTMKAELESKIKVLEEELKTLKENSGIEVLESENENLIQERDSLLQRLTEAESAASELRSQYSLLMMQYTDLEKKYDNITHAPPPPPPPPPPPLPPPTSKTEGFLAKITGGKRKKIQQRLAEGGAEITKDYSKAVEEMMNRIKKGNIGLRPVRTNAGNDPGAESDSLRRAGSKSTSEEDGKAMKELQNILSKMKKVRSDEDLTVPEESSLDENSELAKAFRKIQQTKQDTKNERPKPAPRGRLAIIKDEQE